MKQNDPIFNSAPENNYYLDIKSKIDNRTNDYPAGMLSNQSFFNTITPYDILEHFKIFKKNLSSIAERLNYSNLKILNGLSTKNVTGINDNNEILCYNTFESNDIIIVDDIDIN